MLHIGNNCTFVVFCGILVYYYLIYSSLPPSLSGELLGTTPPRFSIPFPPHPRGGVRRGEGDVRGKNSRPRHLCTVLHLSLGVAGWRSGRPGPCRGANNGTPVFLFRAPMPLSKFCSPVRSLFGPRCLGENFALVGVACWSLSV